MKAHLLTACLSALVIIIGVTPSYAETVTTKTTVRQMELLGGEKIDFKSFDINQNGILSMQEVGKKLFDIFDQDDNRLIDNNEFVRNVVLTIIPMEKETIRMVDFDDDGHADVSSYDYQSFIKESRLLRFDEDRDGLSAKDFISLSFLQTDDNDDGVVDIEEWEEVYADSVRYAHEEPENYN